MFLSEIHPRVRKELHRRKFILQRTPNDTKKIAQTTPLDPTKENRDLLAESFARSSWIRVFSPINSVFLIDEKWKNELFNIRKVKPLFGEDNRYFEPGGNKDLIKVWNDFSKPEKKFKVNPRGGYNTVLLQSGLMGRKNIEQPEVFGADGEWTNRNKMFAGFKEVYGRGKSIDDPLASKSELKQSYVGGVLPIPGIKNVIVNYKGGVKAIRESTIEWVCWSAEDLQLLTPHFLTMGKLVVLEWGWGGLGGDKTPILLDYEKIYESATERKDKPNLHDEIRDKVFENGGNYDAMVGTISNFEWTLRSDGGFDCTTKIVSRGISILNLVIGGGGPEGKSSVPLTLDERIEQELGIDVKLSKKAGWVWDHDGNITDIPWVIDFGSAGNLFDEGFVKYKDDTGNPYITYGLEWDEKELPKSQGLIKTPELTFNNFIRQVKSQVKEIGESMSIKSNTLKEYIESVGDNTGDISGYIKFMKNEESWKDINITEGVIYPAGWGFLNNVEVGPWLSWGWIEDNILTRFLGKVDDKDNIIQEFRSVDAIYDKDKFLGYEPVKISNHRQLITVDPDICIIPGQYPLSKSQMSNDLWAKIFGLGDNANNRAMVFAAQLIDQHTFPMSPAPFRAYKWSDEKSALKPIHPSKSKTVNGYHNIARDCTPIYEAGYMRHLLIHINIFEEAFRNSGTVEAACQYLFNKLNNTSGIWDLQLSTEDGDRIKVVDRNYTDNKMWELLNESAESKCANPASDDPVKGKVTGKLFIFPSWQRDSMVKSQTLTAKFPDASAVTAMYGGLAVPGADAPLGGGNSADFLASSTIFSTIDPTQDGVTYVWDPSLGKKGKFGTKYPYNLNGTKGKWSSFGVGHGFDFNISQDGKNKVDSKSVNEAINRDIFLRNKLVENFATIIGDTGEYTDFSSISEYRDNFGNTRLKITDIIKYEENLEEYQSGKNTMKPDDIEVPKTAAGGYVQHKPLGDLISDPYDELYDIKGKLKNESPFGYVDAMKYIIGISRSTSVFAIGGSSPLLDMELDIEIQGIGGITPGNVFSVNMLPHQYLDNALFQATEINHEISDTGWNTELKGQMRVSIKHPIAAAQKPGVREKYITEGSKGYEKSKDPRLHRYLDEHGAGMGF